MYSLATRAVGNTADPRRCLLNGMHDLRFDELEIRAILPGQLIYFTVDEDPNSSQRMQAEGVIVLTSCLGIPTRSE